MKKFFLILLISISNLLLAQKENIDSKIIFKDGTELNTKIKFRVNMFANDQIDESSVAFKNVLIMDKNNKFVKTPSSIIQRIDFTDLKGIERHFVKMPDYKNLVEVKYDGKIKWYKLYDIHAYDRSTTVQDYLYIGDKSYFFSILKNNPKKLKEFFSNRTDLFPLIEKINYNRLNEEDLYSLLKKYDE